MPASMGRTEKIDSHHCVASGSTRPLCSQRYVVSAGSPWVTTARASKEVEEEEKDPPPKRGDVNRGGSSPARVRTATAVPAPEAIATTERRPEGTGSSRAADQA